MVEAASRHICVRQGVKSAYHTHTKRERERHTHNTTQHNTTQHNTHTHPGARPLSAAYMWPRTRHVTNTEHAEGKPRRQVNCCDFHGDDQRESTATMGTMEDTVMMQNPRLQKLGNYVSLLCRVNECGGRLFYSCSEASTAEEREDDDCARDGAERAASCRSSIIMHPWYDTCVLMDLCQWGDEVAICVKSRFPDVAIRVVHSTTSLTGFGVVLTLPPQPQQRLYCCDGSQSSAQGSSSSGTSRLADQSLWKTFVQQRRGPRGLRQLMMQRCPLPLRHWEVRQHVAGLLVLGLTLCAMWYTLERIVAAWTLSASVDV